MNIDLQPEYIKLVQQILQKHLPVDAKVWVFGSRARKTAKKFSDLDLAIDTGKPLSLELLAKLAEEFEESALPYKVDIVDWATIDDLFRKKIEQERVVIF